LEYKEVKQQLEATKQKLSNKLQNPSLSIGEREDIQKTLINYEYIIELTDMNHFERGMVAH
jgi:hypothetical protein